MSCPYTNTRESTPSSPSQPTKPICPNEPLSIGLSLPEDDEFPGPFAIEKVIADIVGLIAGYLPFNNLEADVGAGAGREAPQEAGEIGLDRVSALYDHSVGLEVISILGVEVGDHGRIGLFVGPGEGIVNRLHGGFSLFVARGFPRKLAGGGEQNYSEEEEGITHKRKRLGNRRYIRFFWNAPAGLVLPHWPGRCVL